MVQDCYKQDLKQKKHMHTGNINPLGEFSLTFIFILSHDKIPTLKFIIVKL